MGSLARVSWAMLDTTATSNLSSCALYGRIARRTRRRRRPATPPKRDRERAGAPAIRSRPPRTHGRPSSQGTPPASTRARSQGSRRRRPARVRAARGPGRPAIPRARRRKSRTTVPTAQTCTTERGTSSGTSRGAGTRADARCPREHDAIALQPAPERPRVLRKRPLAVNAEHEQATGPGNALQLRQPQVLAHLVDMGEDAVVEDQIE